MSKFKSLNDITIEEWNSIRPTDTKPDKTNKVLNFPPKIRNEERDAQHKSKGKRTI
jgi:hypothetical protein